jgi:hypothetical protein
MKMQAAQQAVPNSITTKGVPDMLPAVGDAVDPVYNFLRVWL